MSPVLSRGPPRIGCGARVLLAPVGRHRAASSGSALLQPVLEPVSGTGWHRAAAQPYLKRSWDLLVGQAGTCGGSVNWRRRRVGWLALARRVGPRGEENGGVSPRGNL